MKRVSKYLVALLLCAVLIASLPILTSCKDEKEDEEEPYSIKECYIASDMPSNTGSIEWLDKNGASTTFDPYKPSVILLVGRSQANVNDSYKLPTSIYYYGEGGVLGSNNKNMHTDTAWYWSMQGFNVGIFHGECFTAESNPDALAKKATDKTAMSYVNTNDTVAYSNDVDYNLAELLCSAWEKTLKDNPMKGTSVYGSVQEVRLIANDTAITLALEATSLLFEKYSAGNFAGNGIANRITFTEPYLTDGNIDYCLEKIKNFAQKGMVFEIVDKTEKALFEDGSEGATKYDEMLKYSTYLGLRETYSKCFDTQYAELTRVCLDWYLYSVSGSDSDKLSLDIVTNLGKNNTLPILDKISGADGSTPSMNTCRYALSAWTPTVYMRALRGVKFDMKDLYNAMLGEYREYTLEKFSSECFQFSDYSGLYVAGYVFNNKDGSMSINYGYDCRLDGMELSIKVTNVETEKSTTQNIKTEADGFYKLLISEKDLQLIAYIDVLVPNSYYSLYTTKKSSGTYEMLSKSHISVKSTDSAGGGMATFTSPVIVGQIVINNCAVKVG